MGWPIVAGIVGSSLVGGILGSSSSKKAAKAQERAAAMSIAEQRRQYDLMRQDLAQIREDQAPYREAGTEALDRLRRMSTGDMSSFYKSPDYQFRLGEGQKAIDRSLAARGRALSGAGVRRGIRYASDLASGEYGNYWNRQAGLAGVGQASLGQTGQAGLTTGAAGMNMAGNIGNYLTGAGSARANAYMNTGQALNQSIQGGLQNYLLYRNLQQPTTRWT